MPDPLDSKAPAGRSAGPAPAAAGSGSPLILIPVTAEDAARKIRRTRLIWVSSILAVAAVAFWIYKRSADPVKAQQALDTAQHLFDIARYDQAIVACERAVGLNSGLTAAYILSGRAHAALYEQDKAIADFTKAASLSPKDAQILLYRASTYAEQKKFSEALADTAAILSLTANSAAAYNLRGTALRAMGQPEQAVEAFSKAVQLDPSSDNYYQRGATYQLLNDHRHAIDDFTQAISFDGDKPQAYFSRAESERALGDIKKAEQDHDHGRILDGR